jgi:hypothetical protein
MHRIMCQVMQWEEKVANLPCSGDDGERGQEHLLAAQEGRLS